MSFRRCMTIIVALVFALACLAGGGVPAGASDSKVYVCPPCGADCHHLKFDAPGRCPVCGMALVERKTIKAAAILLFPGVQIIDYSGPYEVLGQANIQVYTVAEKTDALTTAMGLSVNPTYTFENLPAVDIVVVPGGHVDAALSSPATMQWIKESAARADYVLSVCNGAFILAKAGLLDGLKATTFHRLIDDLKEAAPKTSVVSDQRFVDNGKIITSAGLSSGIDAALHLLSRIYGKGRAEQVALNLEYDWRPEANFARAALADRLLRGIAPPSEIEELKIESTSGTRDEWKMVWLASTEASIDTILSRLNATLSTREGWSMKGAVDGETEKGSSWKVTDSDGKPWIAVLTLSPVGAKQLRLSLEIKQRAVL